MGEFREKQWLEFLADEDLYNEVKKTIQSSLIRPITNNSRTTITEEITENGK